LALGGGLEVGLHCHYRTVSSTAFTALPEVFLGLVPGWGGATILPKLIGPERAVQVIMLNALNNNTMMKAKDALKLGVVDAMFDPADFLERSIGFAVGVLNGTTNFAGVLDGCTNVSVRRGRQDQGDQFAPGTMSFQMLDKLATPIPRNPFYAGLIRASGQAPQWNFHKYLIDRQGRVKSFPSAVEPTSRQLTSAIDAALQAK
jgi:enoyl-CoA hydratase/carnithine racemase